jgi:hypothetical protein
MGVPTIVIELPLEGPPNLIYRDCGDLDDTRLNDWLRTTAPDADKVIRRLIKEECERRGFTVIDPEEEQP